MTESIRTEIEQMRDRLRVLASSITDLVTREMVTLAANDLDEAAAQDMSRW